MTRYINVVETAKMIRVALKESFPGVKFSVKSSSYSMGASININYVDGPTNAQVKAVIRVFEGSYFDGMTDYKGLNYSSLDGEEVRFGADFVFVNRKFSVDLFTNLVASACKYYGYAIPEIKDNVYSGAFIANSISYEENRRIMEKVCEYSADDGAESATLKRIAFLGNDGYGYGAVGRIAG